MDYFITNQYKKVFIRLNGSGQPETCVKAKAQRFPEAKANNILKNLPRTLQSFQFMLLPLEEESKEEKTEVVKEKTTIKAENYVVPDTINKWVARIDAYNSLVSEARTRKEELLALESNVDKELSNCLHMIEMTKWKSGCGGYKEYKKMKTLLEKRRSIKDEISIVQSISAHDIEKISVDHVVNRLKTRDFTVREVEDYEFLIN